MVSLRFFFRLYKTPTLRERHRDPFGSPRGEIVGIFLRLLILRPRLYMGCQGKDVFCCVCTVVTMEDFAMKKWVLGLTAFLGLGMIMSGMSSLLGAKPIMEAFARLKAPTHLAVFLGIAKTSAGVMLLLLLWKRDWVRWRQWVFAGLTFNMAGAVWWHLAAGDTLQQTMGPIILLVLLLVTWALGESQERTPNAS